MPVKCFLLIPAFALLAACAGKQPAATLRDIDITGGKADTQGNFIKPKNEEEIRRAYANYIKYADKEDVGRLSAITRLAEIEFEISERLRQEQNDTQQTRQPDVDDGEYMARLDKTIELLTTSLNDYPNGKNNDKLLYQLAKAYDQKGDYDRSIAILRRITTEYPKSPYYAEAQFRIGEQAFSNGRYLNAEDAYTEVIVSPKRDIFYEKAVFKRGWSRFKQQLYDLAVDDFMEAVTYHRFDELDKLNKSEHEQFDEYFRSIGLAFSYLGGAEPLRGYFQNSRDFKYIYYTYATISDIYVKQERFSDAADTMQQYTREYPGADNLPLAELKIIDVWRLSGFTDKLNQSIENFYVNFNPGARYWLNQSNNETIQRQVGEELKKYILLSCSYFHNRYQKSKRKDAFENADKWYRRYMEHYSSFARQDNMYFLYAELLLLAGKAADAMPYYELAAYDGELILNKDAAYATVLISSRLFEDKSTTNKDRWLDKHIEYSLRYSRLYPDDPQADKIILHASDLAFAYNQFERAIALTSLVRDAANKDIQIEAGELKAQSLFKLGKYQEAEEMYQRMLGSGQIRGKARRKIEDGLALSIYKQAETAMNAGNRDLAYSHYIRIAHVAKQSEISATGLYDAIAIAMQDKQWNNAINAIHLFQAYYPKHKYSADVVKKLSVAYLNSDQKLKAAEQLEKVSDFEQNRELKMAALWQAAQLHLQKKNTNDAIRLFTEYTNTYKDPFPQYLEAMNHLIDIYEAGGQTANATIWRKRIINANSKAYKNQKTERTQFIASSASLKLAQQRQGEFEQIQLVNPIKTNLHKKKTAMQAAVQLYGQTSAFGIHETTTESIFEIGSIYEHFSKALLNSERPLNLKGAELEQYEILLEDQAFPFEAKAIEFYETNLSRVPEGGYNDWIAKGLARLEELFPARYKRHEKVDASFQVTN